MNVHSKSNRVSLLEQGRCQTSWIYFRLPPAVMAGVSPASEVAKCCFFFAAEMAAATSRLPGGRVELPTKGL